jgi:rhodanese-related sulfurtransferase
MTNVREPFKRITVDEAKALWDKKDTQVQFVDVREPSEYVVGHVPGVVLMPVNSVFARIKELDKEKELVFLCAVGQRSALACEIAAAMGYRNLYNVEGGTDAWVKKGYPVETGGQ